MLNPERQSWDGEIPVRVLRPSTTNPRIITDEAKHQRELEELAASIRQHGLLVRLLVRPVGKNPRYESDRWCGVRFWEIVLGERRWQAAKLAGLESIPVTVQILDAEQAKKIQKIESAFTSPVPVRNRPRLRKVLVG